MNKVIIVTIVLFVALADADEKSSKYTQIIQPASRQLPPSHDGYQSDGVYPQQTAPYQMAYQSSNEGIYPPASEDPNVDTQAHQAEQVWNHFNFA